MVLTLIAAPAVWTQSVQTTGPISKPVVRVVPLTVHYEEIVHKPGRRPATTQEMILAIRSDGATARVQVFRALDGVSVIDRRRVIGFPNGDHVEVNDLLKLVVAVKTRLALPSEFPTLTAASSCRTDLAGYPAAPNEVLSGTEVVSGYKTSVFRRETARARFTNWRAPDLGCVELRRLTEFKDRDGVISDTSDLRAVRIVRGEPDTQLFHVDAAYERVSFSERYRRECQHWRQPIDASVLARLSRDDLALEGRWIRDLSTLGKTPRIYTAPR
ncbi:MAG: hypothetical protein RMK57_00730 [Bryobacterales bacterium]|nr:hypothetical protein [Bryobacteraceae bacterium]MDW8353029.1 hypothetical protein [Bryobacterales bacterium]